MTVFRCSGIEKVRLKMSHAILRFIGVVPLGAVLLFGTMFIPPAAHCQQANSTGQKAQPTKAKPPQNPPTSAMPPKSTLKTSLPKQTAPVPALPTANPQQPTPILPPSPPPPLRIGLVGPLPVAMQQAAHVDVEANAPGNSLPAFWRGNARTPAFRLAKDAAAPPPALSDLAATASLRKSAGATLTRLHPFATPGTLTLHPDGTPIVRWESVDAALRQAGQAGEDVILDVQCPAALSPEGWRALAEGVLRRYRENPPAPIARWEAALSATEAITRYEPFARLARSLYSTTPVGLNLIAGEDAAGNGPDKNKPAANMAEDMRRIAQICAQKRVPLDSLAWRLGDTPGLAAQQVERIRRALSAFPALKNVFLLPTLPATSANLSPDDAVFPAALFPVPRAFAPPVSFVSHLLEAVSASPPNALVGALLEEPLPPLPGQIVKAGDASNSINRDAPANGNRLANPEFAQGALALLNRMAGTRLKASSDDGGIGCLATRSRARTWVLLWREPASYRAPARPARFRSADNALIVVRLHHPGLENSNGLRVTQTDMAQANVDSLHPVSTAMPVLNGPSGRPGVGAPDITSLLPPSGAADTFWSAKGEATAPPSDMEIPVLLEPGSVCLLELDPLKAKNPLAAALTIDAGNVGNGADLYGGDPLKVVLTVRNLSPRPQSLDIVLASPFRDLLPPGAARFKPGVLPVNGGRAFQFALHAPTLGTNANITLTARIGENAASLTVPVQTPLQATLEAPRTDLESGTGRANVRVRLLNRSRAPLNVHLQAGEKTGTSVQVPAGGKPVVTTLAVSPTSREPGLYAVPLQLESSARVLQTLRPLIGVPVVCPYAVVKPVIDGDLKEWAENVPLGMGRAEQARGKKWGGPSDVSAYAYESWDEQFFYIACAVTDDVFTPPTRAAGLMQGDCVLFALSAPPRANSPASATSYAKFGMAVLRNSLGASVPTLVRLMPDAKAPGKETPVAVKNARIAVRQEDTRTFYEAAIPWSELLPAPTTSASPVSLSILVNDVDGSARGAMEWGNGLYESINPLLFLPLRLVKLPAP